MSKKKLLPFLILLISVGGFAALVASKPERPPVEAGKKNWPVRVITAEPGTYSPILSLFGRVETPFVTRINSAVTATVTELLVREGQSVSAGQTLIKLDERDYQYTLEQREAEWRDIRAQLDNENTRHQSDLETLEDEKALLALNRREVSREKDLLKKNLGSASRSDESQKALKRQQLSVKQRQLSIDGYGARLDRLNAQLQRAEALRNQAKLNLSRTHITAPFNGLVTITQVSPGNHVRTGDWLLSMYNDDELEVRAQFPLKYAALIRASLNDHRQLLATTMQGAQPITLKLNRLAGQIQQGSGGIDGLFSIAAGAQQLTLGQTIELDVRLPAQGNVIELPASALYGRDSIYRVHNNRLQLVPIEYLGKTISSGRTEKILIRGADITAGDQIMITQLPNAVEGLAVTVMDDPAN